MPLTRPKTTAISPSFMYCAPRTRRARGYRSLANPNIAMTERVPPLRFHLKGRKIRYMRGIPSRAGGQAMKVSISGVGFGTAPGTAKVTAIAINAERLGFSTLWVPEHVVLLDQYSSPYPYAADHRMNLPMTRPFFDPFLTLTCAATVTSKIRLATGICLVPEHNPLVLGKVVATLDYLSAGRTIFGVGIGWLEEEF